MKKILSVFLSIVMLLSITAGIDLSAYAETYNDLVYEVLDDGTAKITGYNGSPNDVSIPSTIDGYTVTSIGDDAFSWCASLMSVTIPNTVTTIGEAAFIGTTLKSVVIPANVKIIENSVFQCCTSLTSVTIPNGVTKIGDYAFEECQSLTSVTIPNSVTEIGSGTFEYCESLTSVTIPNGVTKIYDRTFSNCKKFTSITIPNSITEIGSGAFTGCEGLTSVTIPNSVKTIDDSAFAFCTGLKSVTIPNSVTSIGDCAFESCTSLSTISVSSSNPNYTSVDGVLFNKNKTILIQYPTGSAKTVYNIPSSVTTVNNRSFGYCTNLTSVTIPNSVTTIEPYAFIDCSGLTSVTIPNSITSIGDSVFEYCSSLKNVTIPNSVNSIGDYAFAYCTGLKSVTIPNSVTSIGYWAFSDCLSLTNVTIPVSVTSLGVGAFFACKGLENISVDYNNPNYTSVDGVLFNKDKTILIQYPIGNTRTSYVVPNSVKTIVEYAFQACTNLISLTIPDSVESVGGLYNLNNVIYNGELDSSKWGAKAINGYVDGLLVYSDSTKTKLLGCSSLATSITIPNSVTSIGNAAFYYCTGLTSITIPDSVTSLGDYAFYYCDNLTSVAIGSGLSSIGFGSFSGCTSLSTISVSSSNPNYSSLDGVLFNNDKTELIVYPMGNSRTAYNIPSGVITILEESFANCEKLRSVTIPKSVKRIGFFAFGIYKTLTDVYYTGSEKDWLGIQIDGHNDNLLSANIHFNSLEPCTKHTPANPVKENVKNATCKAAGSYDSVVYCSVCKYEISRTNNTIPKTAHKYDAGKVTKAATCKATGVKTYTCTVCKATKTATIAKTAHTYKNYVTKATLTANGKIVNKCSVCGVVKSTTAIPMVKTVTISATNYNYDGKVKTPAVTVKDSKGKTLRKGTDYDVTYSSGRKNVGKYAVKITLKGNYSGTKTLYFNINPKGTTIAKLTPKSRAIAVQWKKQTNQTTGYQIQYSVYSNFKSAKTITMSKNTYYAKSITGLSGNKRYYVRIRTYKKVGSTNYYSSWSSAKYTTTKR